jgi:hypothetical protein
MRDVYFHLAAKGWLLRFLENQTTMRLLPLALIAFSLSAAILFVAHDQLQTLRNRQLILGGYVVCVKYKTQQVPIWLFLLYLVLGFLFGARPGACIGRDGWVWGAEGKSCMSVDIPAVVGVAFNCCVWLCCCLQESLALRAGGSCNVELTQMVDTEKIFRSVGAKYKDLVAFNCGDDYIDSDAPGVPFTKFDSTLNRVLCTYTIADVSSSRTTCDDAIAGARRICCCGAKLCTSAL